MAGPYYGSLLNVPQSQTELKHEIVSCLQWKQGLPLGQAIDIAERVIDKLTQAGINKLPPEGPEMCGKANAIMKETLGGIPGRAMAPNIQAAEDPEGWLQKNRTVVFIAGGALILLLVALIIFFATRKKGRKRNGGNGKAGK